MTKATLILMVGIWGFTDCNRKPHLDKDFLYATINEIIQSDTIFARYICVKFEPANISASIREDFFKRDKEFVDEQIRKSADISVDTGRIIFYWRNKGLTKSVIDSTCSEGFIYRLSYPIFSKDLQTVAFGVSEDCHCLLGGWAREAIYRRQVGRWILVKTYYDMISFEDQSNLPHPNLSHESCYRKSSQTL